MMIVYLIVNLEFVEWGGEKNNFQSAISRDSKNRQTIPVVPRNFRLIAQINFNFPVIL